MSSLPQSLIVISVILQVPCPMGWNEVPIIQGEVVTGVLHLLDTHRSMELYGINPRVLRELMKVTTEPL